MFFSQLSEIGVDIMIRKMQAEHQDVDFEYIHHMGVLCVRLKTEAVDEKTASADIEQAFGQVKDAFQNHVFESRSGKIEESVHDIFINNGLTLCLAESCTGGAIAAQLTKLPNASKYFLGSVISYSDLVKKMCLVLKRVFWIGMEPLVRKQFWKWR